MRGSSPPRRPAARRLTLAPAPVPAELRGRAGEALGAPVTPLLSEVLEGKLSADPLAGRRSRAYGSKFWPLAGDLSSDEEDETEEDCGRSLKPGQQEWTSAVLCSGSDVAPVVLPSVVELTSNVRLPSCAAGPVTARKGVRNGQLAGAAAPPPSKTKPWRGPLPPARVSPRLTLADALASARRSEQTGVGFGVPGDLAGRSSPASGAASVRSPVSPDRPRTRDLGASGRVVGALPGPGCSVQLRLGGRLARFSFATGLCGLFSHAGRSRRLIPLARASSSFDASGCSHIHSSTTIGVPCPVDERVPVVEEAKHCYDDMDRRGAGAGGRGRGFGGQNRDGAEEGAGGRGRGPGQARGVEEEGLFNGGGRGDFQGGDLGFDPGYGDASSRGRGWHRGGVRSRGSRGFGPRRGGHAGRPGRGGRAWRAGAPQRGSSVGTRGGHTSQAYVPVADAGGAELPPPAASSGVAVMEIDMDVEVEEKETTKAGRKDRSCSRCALKGHLAADCSTELYCVICDGHDHVNHRCHLLKQPRPVAHAVGYAVAGLGFYHIPHPPLSRKKDSKTALVKVVGGTLSIDQVVAQLQRVVSSKWKWEPVTHDEDSFVVQFPSKNELQRAIAFGGADVRDKDVPSGVRLQFDEWHEEEEGYLLPKVWIRVTGIRKKLREFLNLWAIGSMLGSTQTVDMETTRKSNFGRILVAVLDPKLLPPKLDTVIGDHYFDLKFELEPVGFDDNGDEVIFNFEEGNDGENQGMEEDDPNAERGLDREGKRSRREHVAAPGEQDAALGKDGTSANSNKNTLTMSDMLREEMEAKVQRMAAEIIDMAVDKTLDFCVDNVLAEEDDEQGLGAMEDDSSAFETFSDGSGGVGWVTGSEIAASEKLPPVDRPGRAGERLVAGCLVRRGSGSAPPTFRAELQQPDLGARPTDQLTVAAGIKEAALSPTRASPRLASVADQHILEKAKKRAAWRNLDTEGNLQGYILDPHVVAAV